MRKVTLVTSDQQVRLEQKVPAETKESEDRLASVYKDSKVKHTAL